MAEEAELKLGDLQDNCEYVFSSKGEPIKLAEEMTKHEKNIRKGKFLAFDPIIAKNLLDTATSLDLTVNEGAMNSKHISLEKRSIAYQNRVLQLWE